MAGIEPGAEIRGVPPGAGLRWLAAAWALFTPAAGMWIVYTLIVLVCSVLAGVLPVVGIVAGAFLAPILFAGQLEIAARIARGEPHDLPLLFVGFTDPARRNGLLVLGALSAAAQFGVMFIGVVLFGARVATALITGDFSPYTLLEGALLGLLVLLLLLAAIAMALLYAVPLVHRRGVAPLAAIGASFRVSIVNIVPLSLAGLVFAVLGVLASIPALLGWLVLWPLTVCAVYVSFEEMFPAPAPAPDA